MDSSRRSPFSPRSPRVRRVAERTLLAAVIAGSVLVAEVPASAQDPDELKERQEEVRADRRAAEDDLDVLGADLSDAQRALKATDRRIADVERKLAVSERDLADANRQAEEAASQQAEASGQVNRLRRQVRRMAVDSYLQPGREQMELLESDDLGTAVRSNTLRGFATGERQDVIDDFRSERQDLEAAEEYAVKAGERAAELRDELDGQAAELAKEAKKS